MYKQEQAQAYIVQFVYIFIGTIHYHASYHLISNCSRPCFHVIRPTIPPKWWMLKSTFIKVRQAIKRSSSLVQEYFPMKHEDIIDTLNWIKPTKLVKRLYFTKAFWITHHMGHCPALVCINMKKWFKISTYT